MAKDENQTTETGNDEPNQTNTTDQTGGATEKKDDKAQTYDLTVGGEQRSVTLQEMQKLAEKAAGADKRFEDAAQMRKEAEKGLRITSLIESLSQSPDETDARELATLLGVDPNDFVKWMDDGGERKPPQKQDSDRASAVSKDALVAGLKELGLDPAEVKSVLDYSHQRHIEAAKAEIRAKSDEMVDKDSVFGKMIVGENKDARLEVIKDLVAEDVLRKIQDGTPFGAELLTASVQKIRAHLTKFGIPNKPERYPVMGLGPGQGLPTEISTDETIERVSADKDDNESNLIARYMQKIWKGRREGA